MSYARQMLDTYSSSASADAEVLAAAIDEQNLADMVTCIRLCLECTDICTATVGVISRPAVYDASVTRPLLEACVASCKSCGDECERHARMHAHCRVCEQACRRCEQACRELLAALK
jgi:hypothetical protein